MRAQMNASATGEKQSVIKELPPAEWHGALWSDAVRIYKESREQIMEKKKAQDALEQHIADAQRRDKALALRRW